MKLRSIILSAIALAFTASFTSCDKDDDDKTATDNTFNIYQTWELNIDKDHMDATVTNVYCKFDKDSLMMYERFSDSQAEVYGASTDSVYCTGTITLDSAAVASTDSAMVTGLYGSTHYKFVMRKTAEAKYTMTYTIYTSTPDTVTFNVTPVTGLNFSDRKF